MGFRILSKRLNCFILPAHSVNLESVPTCFARWTTWTNTDSDRLARRAIYSTVRLIEGLILCVHVRNRHTLDPPVKRGIMLERRSVLIAFALPSVRGTTACHLTICRGTFPHLPTVRCSGLSIRFRLVRSRAYTLPRLAHVVNPSSPFVTFL